MISFYSISEFRNSLRNLCAKKKEGYSSVINDICNAFFNVPIENIRMNRDMVLCEDQVIIIKLRLPNSGQNLSKKDGFRLIYLVHKQRDEVIFLHIYPKRGAQSVINISEKEIIFLLKQYIEERIEPKLILHNIEDKLNPFSSTPPPAPSDNSPNTNSSLPA